MDPYDHTPLLSEYDSYESACEEFEWDTPSEYNISTDILETQPDPDSRIALVSVDDDTERRYTYTELDTATNRVANLLVDHGVTQGDRVAVVAPNSPTTLLSQLAVFKIGAVLVPVSAASDAESVDYKLSDSNAEYLISTAAVLDRLAPVVELSGFESVVSVDDSDRAALVVQQAQSAAPASFETCRTTTEDPAMVIYTSGTTGDPKGVVHSHSHFIGCYPGAEMWNNLEVGPDRTYWANGEWAHVGSLCYLYTALHYGGTFVDCRLTDQYDASTLFAIIQQYDVTNVFLKPRRLKQLWNSDSPAPSLEALSVISTGGSPYPAALFEWVESALGATPVEAYGQTEGQLFISDCPAWFETVPDRIGKSTPGADLRIVDQRGEDVGTDTVGELALETAHPVAFDSYWQLPEKTAAAQSAELMCTDVMCRRDDSGYIEYVARKGDIIVLDSQYVTPTEIEAVVNSQPEVLRSGVVGDGDHNPDIVAYVTLTETASERAVAELSRQLRSRIADQLAAHQVPDRIEPVDELPTTKRGKIRRTALRD